MYNFEGKRLALMGTENGAQEVADYCKKHGITLISFGSKADAKIHMVSDESCIVDCTNPEIMIPLLKEKKIDGVFLATSEKVIRKCIQYFDKANIRHYSTLEQWDALMNKNNFKKIAKEYEISIAPNYLIDYENCKIIGAVQYPVVIKPADSCGSVGISICNDDKEVKDAIDNAKKYSMSESVVCEKMLSDKGKFFQFELWACDGEIYFPYVKERIFYKPVGKSPKQPFIDIIPASCEELIREYYYEKMKKLFSDLNILNGHCWFQGIIENGVPYLFDTGFRLGGGKDYSITKKEKSVDLIENYIQFALAGKFGENNKKLEQPFKQKYAVISIGLKNGLIDKIDGIDKLLSDSSVFDYYQYYFENDEMTRSGLYAQALCRIYISGSDDESLKSNIQRALREITVVDATGKSLICEYPAEYYSWVKE